MSWTIARVLAWSTDYLGAKGSSSPRLDADLLLADVLGLDRLQLYLDPERPLQAGELERYRERIARRATGHPIAYLLGHREFYGRRFRVGPGVLVPRPETEILVEVCLGKLPPAGEGELWAADLGTGSGNIAVTLAAEREDLQVVAIDASEEALAYARQNVQEHGVAERVHLRAGDRLTPLAEEAVEGRLVLLVSNPPYVSPGERSELGFGVERYEPAAALIPSDGDPLSFYRTLTEEAPHYLRPGGWLACEVGARRAGAVAELLGETLEEIAVHRDLAAIPRVVVGRWSGR